MKIKVNVKFTGESNIGDSDSKDSLDIEIGSMTNSRVEKSHCQNDILQLFDTAKLNPSEKIIDLLNLGLAVYTIDQLASRNKFGYYHWNRYFELNIPVFEPFLWENVKIKLSETLSFLSGDKWEFNFRKRKAYYDTEVKNLNTDSIEKVSLFSGGLDSLIGAIDLLKNGEQIALVGHHKVGGRERATQQELIQKLSEKFSVDITKFLFFVQPKHEHGKKNLLQGEDTQRARSFLFLTLGISLANTYGNNVPLIVPENGFISLNIPLTPTRLGTYSTKTTHPYFITRFVEVLNSLEISNPIINPYQFNTKGEMIKNCQAKNKELISIISNSSISCSKPGYYKRYNHKGSPKINADHCGHCVPCIIRRAAMYKAKLDILEGNYAYDVKTFDKNTNSGKGADLHAFKIGIEKYITQNKLSIFELLKSGALPEKDIQKYLDLARNGYEEVNDFLLSK